MTEVVDVYIFCAAATPRNTVTRHVTTRYAPIPMYAPAMIQSDVLHDSFKHDMTHPYVTRLIHDSHRVRRIGAKHNLVSSHMDESHRS